MEQPPISPPCHSDSGVEAGRSEQGSGTYVGAGKVTYNKEKNSIEIENYGTEPVRLSIVQVRE